MRFIFVEARRLVCGFRVSRAQNLPLGPEERTFFFGRALQNIICQLPILLLALHDFLPANLLASQHVGSFSSVVKPT